LKDIQFAVDTVSLHVRDYEHEGETIIFLHFGGGNLMMWQRAIQFFENQYRMVLVDLRDHGKSEKPQIDGHIDTMARDIAGLIDKMSLKKVHIIGCSLGAEVGVSLAANFPEKIISLTCDGAKNNEFGEYSSWIDTLESFNDYKNKYISSLRVPDQIFSSVDDLVEEMFKELGDYGDLNEYFEELFKYEAFEVSPGKFTKSWQNKAKMLYFIDYFNYQFQDYYSRIQCPVTILTSDEEYKNELSCKAIEGLIKLAPKGRIAILPGWSHPYGWLIDPQEACKLILDFFQEIYQDTIQQKQRKRYL
jgi:pimeloyl-ACP methyl ester carboxylesterase